MKRALTVLLLTALTILSTGTPATAAPALPFVDCKTAPTPEVPGRGVTGFFETTPNPLPAPADPFATNPTTTIYEQYGYAGLKFTTYDLGCGPDVARSPDAVIGTAVANWALELPKTVVAATGALLTAAYHPTFLAVFDPLITRTVTALQHAIFERWAALILGLLGATLIWRARTMRISSTATAVGWALLIMVISTAVFRWPLLAGHTADRGVTGTLATITASLNGTTTTTTPAGAGGQATAGLHNAVLYQAWLGGTFGNAHSAIATKYGPTIFDATALTWNEAHTLETNPTAGQKILATKQTKYETAAAAIKTEDPDAYEYLTGRNSDTRVGYAILAGLAALCAVPFLFVSAILIIGALIIVRFGVMLFPAFATLGLYHPLRHIVTGAANTIAAALINAATFGTGAAVTITAMGIILNPTTGLPPWLAVILMFLLTLVMWVALRPFRRLTTMVPTTHNHLKETLGGVTQVARTTITATTQALTTAASAAMGIPPTVTAAALGETTPRAEATPNHPPTNPEPNPPHAAPAGVPPPHEVTRETASPGPATTPPQVAPATSPVTTDHAEETLTQPTDRREAEPDTGAPLDDDFDRELAEIYRSEGVRYE